MAITRRTIREDSFLSLTEIEALRKIVLALRQKYTRGSIIAGADVDGRDFDNFINRRTQEEGSSYRTQVPHNAFQRRMVDYLVSDNDIIDELVRLSENEPILRQALQTIQRKRSRHARLIRDDPYFEYLESIGMIDDARCRAACHDLEGHYDLYRFTSDGGRIHRSHLTIQEYNSYMKVPFFINRIVLSNQRRRTILGNVYELGSNYFFHGVVLRNDRSMKMEGGYLGSKVMIMKRMPTNEQETLMLEGFGYTSGSAEQYEIGVMKAYRTNRVYDSQRIGVINFDPNDPMSIGRTIEENDLPFLPSQLALQFLKIPLVDQKIYGSLKFDMSPSRVDRLRRR